MKNKLEGRIVGKNKVDYWVIEVSDFCYAHFTFEFKRVHVVWKENLTSGDYVEFKGGEVRYLDGNIIFLVTEETSAKVNGVVVYT